jgi:hypothetical protein
MKRLLPALALVFGAATLADTGSEVEALIARVAQSECTFIRNGSEHDAAEAADHLRLKYRRGKRYVDSAEQFIDRLASESSWSGKAYTLRCDGVTETSRAWLQRQLSLLRAADQP